MKFNCVIGFSQTLEDFILLGVFTHTEDAEAFAETDEAKAASSMPTTVIRNESLTWVEELILRERLGKLHDILLRIEAKLQ